MKIIVISDLHLGIDDRISENVKNRPKLKAFIDKIREEKMADELVIAGDFLDQWFYPGNVELPRDSREFYLACAKNNQGIVDALINLIESGIRVVYVPGYKDFTGYDRPKIFANSGTWVDNNTDDPDNTATFVFIESTHEGDVVKTLKVVGDGLVQDIVHVKNSHIRRAE